MTNLAFLGRVLSTCDIVTSFVQAEWLAGLLAGKFEYPNLQARERFSAKYRAWRLRFAPTTTSTFLATPSVHSYFDELLSDLRSKTLGYRHSTFLSRLLHQFLPLRASNFAKLRQKRGAKRSSLVALRSESGTSDFSQA
mmetsp:Transcript_8308/g.17597  ORF Transcript_8308/g.17597 Transcript_8308/m.17597 type:complete len:139 (-) Transcript_8308:175-591(-)